MYIIKNKLLTFLLFVCVASIHAQPMRFFEFTVQLDSPWQDTSFIAATADLAVIDTALTDLLKPLGLRRFINGKIDYGNGGCNHNAGHWFLWHFIPGQWALTDAAIELCDGRPYSDVDTDTAYWVGVVGQYCPWSGKPVREIPDPLRANDWQIAQHFTIGPNPVSKQLTVLHNVSAPLSLTIYNSKGQALMNTTASEQKHTIDVSQLSPDIYFLRIMYCDKVLVKKFVIVR